MLYLAVNKDELEILSKYPLHRELDFGYWDNEPWIENGLIYLPKGSIEKLTDRKIAWEDEPIELDNDIVESIN